MKTEYLKSVVDAVKSSLTAGGTRVNTAVRKVEQHHKFESRRDRRRKILIEELEMIGDLDLA